MAKPAAVKLDKLRQIRFTFHSFVALDEVCGFDVYKANLGELSPKNIRDLIWAGQLHTDRPLSREKVSSFLPTAPGELAQTAQQVLMALVASFKGEKETPTDDTPANTGGE